MSLIFPKTESSNSSSIISMTSSTAAASSYNMHSRSAATPTLFPLPDSEASSPGATQSGPDCLATSASPLQRIQSIINTLQPQSSLLNSPQCPRKTFLMQPITQEHFDKYDNINTKELVKKVKDQLNRHAISQRMFGEMLEVPHSSLKRILAQPKPWNTLTQKGREHFRRMKMFLEDENADQKMVALTKDMTFGCKSNITLDHRLADNRSSLSSSDDDVDTLDLTMPSHLRNSMNKDGKCGGNTTNGVDSRSTDDLNSDKESVEDGPTSHHRVPPLRHQEKQAAQNEQSVAPFEGRNYSPISSDSDEIDVIN